MYTLAPLFLGWFALSSLINVNSSQNKNACCLYIINAMPSPFAICLLKTLLTLRMCVLYVFLSLKVVRFILIWFG